MRNINTPQYKQSRGRSAKHWRKHQSAQTVGRAIYTILFAQPHIKVSTAAWVDFSGEDKTKLWG